MHSTKQTEDQLVRVIARDAGVRALACLSTNLSNEGRQRHSAQPTATAALSLALTGAALMGAMLKVGQRVALRFEGQGLLRKIITEANHYGKVRGFVSEPNVNLPPGQLGKQDVATALGAGNLKIVKDLRLRELNESVVTLATSEIDKDIELYLNQSEQVPSFVALGAMLADDGKVLVAGGLVIQALPKPRTDTIYQLVERMQELPPVEDILAHEQSPDALLQQLFGDIPYTRLEQIPLRFKCDCSRERSEKALRSLDRDDLDTLLDEGEAVVDCHFCHERYVFDRDDLIALLETQQR